MALADDRPALPPHPSKLFQNLSREHAFEPVALRGASPPPLLGTLYRNGVGLMESFGRRYDQLFQADGALHAFRFSPAGLSVAARLVQSRGLVEERAAGQHLGSLPKFVLETVDGRAERQTGAGVAELLVEQVPLSLELSRWPARRAERCSPPASLDG